MHSAFRNKGWPPEEKALAELYPGPHRVGSLQRQCMYPPILGGRGKGSVSIGDGQQHLEGVPWQSSG